MANLNKVMIIGNLTRDIELSYTQSQTAIASFGMATNRKYKKKDGEQCEEVCFVDCVAFGATAETLNKYVSKGDPLFIEGRLTFDSWKAQDGSKRNKLKVTVENFQFLSTGNEQQAPKTNQTSNQAPALDDDGSEIPF